MLLCRRLRPALLAQSCTTVRSLSILEYPQILRSPPVAVQDNPSRRSHSPPSTLRHAIAVAQGASASPDPPSDTCRLYQGSSLKREQQPATIKLGSAKSRKSLQSILREYILNNKVGGPDRPEELLCPASLTLLKRHGYTVNDLEQWFSILVADDTVKGAKALLASLAVETNNNGITIPFFVLLHFLERPQLPPAALEYLIHYAWNISSRNDETESLDAGLGLRTRIEVRNASAFTTMITQLLRQCRESWPEGITTVTGTFMNGFGPHGAFAKDQYQKQTPHRWTSQQTIRSNALLRDLATPIPQNPMGYVTLQKSAQFDLLEWMESHSPPLMITREGYRAIISTQLASPKTTTDKDWAEMKAKTWPPWKVDRTGLDVEKGPEYAVPGTLQAIRRAQNAGYGAEGFESVAKVLSGWDIDGTPTIQTRATLFHQTVSARWEPGLPEEEQPFIWAARIRATRTLQEAWAAFLSWREKGFKPRAIIYLAILEKVSAEQERARMAAQQKTSTWSAGASPHQFLAGDGREVAPIPSSPKEGVYISEEPASFANLAAEMYANGVFPQQGQSLKFLISRAPSLEEGCQYIQWASEQNPDLSALLNIGNETAQVLSGIPLAIFNAWIELLCRFPFISSSSRRTVSKRFPTITAMIRDQPILLAIELLTRRKPTHPAPWVRLFSCLASTYTSDGEATGSREPNQVLERYRLMQQLRRQMKDSGVLMNGQIFRLLCVSLERAVVAAHEVSANAEQAADSFDQTNTQNKPGTKKPLEANTGFIESEKFNPRDAVARVTGSGSSYIINLFHSLMGTRDTKRIKVDPKDRNAPALPDLFTIPHASILHAYVRALGMLRNWREMLEFAQWLQTHRQSVEDAVELNANGERLLRRTIVAMRVFSEIGWAPIEIENTMKENNEECTAPMHIRMKMQKLLEACGEWGRWPSNNEMKAYCRAEHGALD